MKILLLEDDVFLSDAIKNALEFKGYEVRQFFNGKKALNETDRYDLYILDINVPGISGLNLLKKLSKQHKYLNAMIMSAINDINSIKEAYKYGCIDYLKKPFYLEELQIKIEKILNKDLTSLIKKDVTLTKKENKLLELLVQNKESIVTYEMIKNIIYDKKTINIETIRVLVKRLRDKLNNKMIKNISGAGYKITF